MERVLLQNPSLRVVDTLVTRRDPPAQRHRTMDKKACAKRVFRNDSSTSAIGTKRRFGYVRLSAASKGKADFQAGPTPQPRSMNTRPKRVSLLPPRTDRQYFGRGRAVE